MNLTYRKITPVLVVDTRPLQNHVPVAGTTWKKNDQGDFTATTGNEGICATLVSFWLSKRADGVMINGLGQFPSQFSLSIAQSAYEIGGTRDALMDDFGIKAITRSDKSRKWYMWKKTRISNAAKAAASWPGYFYLAARGNGGHALGIATKGTPQFFDPNSGILTFSSREDLGKWVPPYMLDWYPDLQKEIGLYGVDH